MHTGGYPTNKPVVAVAAAASEDDEDQEGCQLDEVHRLLRELPSSPVDSFDEVAPKGRSSRSGDVARSDSLPVMKDPVTEDFLASEEDLISHL
jgi:hypothetical protein